MLFLRLLISEFLFGKLSELGGLAVVDEFRSRGNEYALLRLQLSHSPNQGIEYVQVYLPKKANLEINPEGCAID